MINLREQIVKEVEFTIHESGWELPIKLITPSGEILNNNARTGEQLTGQVIYPALVNSADTGLDLIQKKKCVSLARSSLSQIPTALDYSRWICFIPETPSVSATLVPHAIEVPTQGGESLGFIRLYLTDAIQSEVED